MSFPKQGMYFEDVRSRLRKYDSIKGNDRLRDSLINQARIHEGEGAARELNKEFESGFSSLKTGRRTFIYKDGEVVELT